MPARMVSRKLPIVSKNCISQANGAMLPKRVQMPYSQKGNQGSKNLRALEVIKTRASMAGLLSLASTDLKRSVRNQTNSPEENILGRPENSPCRHPGS